jgi:epoxyqueuosine reductase
MRIDNGRPPGADLSAADLGELTRRIKGWGRELGFESVGISGVDLGQAETRLLDWVAHGYHGEMDYMAAHGARRARPAELLPGTVRVICARMNYWPDALDAEAALQDPGSAYVSRYALGRDYHKALRNRLQALADRIGEAVGTFAYRVFTDSAPVMEVELAAKAGLGWRGKHTLLLHREAGSWFFLGEIYTDLALPLDQPESEHCGTCTRCIDICPTGAILAPYQLDARRCISYLTIEHKSAIPEALRPLIGNRIYGCDDCQLVCPWNRFAAKAQVPDFEVRNGLDRAMLTELFAWSPEEFERRMQGSAIRRIGYERWLRNLAVALGNAPTTPMVVAALEARRDHPSALVREHVAWALRRHRPQHRPHPPPSTSPQPSPPPDRRRRGSRE